MTQVFNPADWLPKNDLPEVKTASPLERGARRRIEPVEMGVTNIDDIESIISQIEHHSIDITGDYSTWRNLGFALSDSLGEAGRDPFHRISKFHSEYNPKECDRQFDACLKANGSGITISTFFHIAKDHGLIVERKPKPNLYGSIAIDPIEKDESFSMPNLQDNIFHNLPTFLQRVVEVATSREERDILLLGSLATISSCLPKMFGVYDGKKCYANLYLFVTAQASAGKGRLVLCKELVKPIHKKLRERAAQLKQQYELEMIEYNAKKGKEDGVEKPGKPAEKMLFIPANNSTTGVFQLLFDNDGAGLIFETEGDTLAQAFKSDYGNYSDGFRKAFHHETISYYRRTDREYVDIERPCLSTILSGTPKQVSALIPNAENGLFSRFIFYYMNVHHVWKDVFADGEGVALDDHFKELSHGLYSLYKFLMEQDEIQFSLSIDQRQRFNKFFSGIQQEYLDIFGNDYMATVRRLGLIAFRMCMILTALRIIDTKSYKSNLECAAEDFESVISMIETLIKHSGKVFSELPEDHSLPKQKNKKEKFLEALPKEFNRQKYLEVASVLSISVKSAEAYITEFVKKNLVHREQKDTYLKVKMDA
jgi:hypothetical protein